GPVGDGLHGALRGRPERGDLRGRATFSGVRHGRCALHLVEGLVLPVAEAGDGGDGLARAAVCALGEGPGSGDHGGVLRLPVAAVLCHAYSPTWRCGRMSCPRKRRCPPRVRNEGIFPAVAQRDTVLESTLKSSATSPGVR